MYRVEQHIRQSLIERAAKHSEDDFINFQIEVGWESWMNDFTEVAEDEPPTEEEVHEIDEVLYEIFCLSHGIPYHYRFFRDRYR